MAVSGVDAYEHEAEQMCEELMRESLLADSGQKETYEISAIYDKHRELFSRSALDERLSDRSDTRRRHLASYAVDGYIGASAKELDEELTNAEMSMMLSLDGESFPYRSAPVMIQNETSRSRRLQLDQVYLDALASLDDLRRREWQKAYELAAELGFPNYRDMCDDLGRLRLGWLYGSTGRILEATAPLWQDRVRTALKTVGATADDGGTADISHYFRAAQFDISFPADRLIPALRETLAGMGIRMDSQPYLHLDVEGRPRKSPRAFCAPVRIPDEVWLVIKPHGGQDDFNSLLHEAGHAQHFIHTDPSLPFALRGLGDTSVTEAYAFLFNNLLFNEHWLTQYLGERDWKPFLEFNGFVETWMLRRYCAKLRYEWDLHSGRTVDAPALYTNTLGEHLGVKVSPERCLDDVDEAFYVAQYLRAWHLEAQLREMLEREFGASWFEVPEAGQRLQAMWKLGESMDAWEMAEWLNLGGLDPEPLIRSLTVPQGSTGAP